MPNVTYEIILKNETGGGGGSTKKSGSKAVAKTPKGDDASGFNLDAKKIAKLSYVAARQIGNRVATTYINKVGLRTGNTTLQERMSYDLSVAKRALNIGTAVIMGAVTGNPLAIAAGIGSAVSWGVDIAVAQDQLNLQRAVENIGISQANIRAGAGGDRIGRNTY